MTKYKTDTKQNFSAASNTFLIDHGDPIRVRCLRCKEWCQAIELPEFTMYFCTSVFCTNILELRHMIDGTWELHDYSGLIQEKQVIADLEKLLEQALQSKDSKPPFIPRIVK